MSFPYQAVPHTDYPGHELVEEFIARVEAAATTKQTYRPHLREFAVWLARPRAPEDRAPKTLVEASRADVVRFMGYLKSGDRYAAHRHALTSDSPGAGTRKTILASIRRFYRYLLSIELVDSDPTYAVERPKVHTRPGLMLTAEQLREFLNAPGGPHCRMQAYLLVYTAARVSKLRNLRWRDVDLQDRVLRLHGKGDKYCGINIHPRLMPELRRYQLWQEDLARRNRAIEKALADPETAFVLLTREGKMIPYNAIYKQFQRRVAKSGIVAATRKHREWSTHLSPHAMRRTFATILLNDGVHLDAVADVLGHTSLDTTHKHYAFSSNERRKTTIEGYRV